jgi:hypothetical protein
LQHWCGKWGRKEISWAPCGTINARSEPRRYHRPNEKTSAIDLTTHVVTHVVAKRRPTMSKVFTVILVLTAISLVAGCVTSQSMALGPTTFPPRPRDYVIEVYVGVDAPVNVQKSIAHAKSITSIPSGAVEIGRIDTQGAPAASWGAVIADAKTRARALGGDGIVIGQWGQPATGVDGYGRMYYGKALSMTVIRYNP